MPVIGTAGHVDHGKSTLVKALTGREPDRWEEERRRGLTIDLGFAWLTLPTGVDASFVDVPGHEHFIKNMLSGIESIDIALLVVAADEGWMPQTEEHLAILDLLEIERSVVAVTKIDRVDSDLIELATLEIEERLAGTVVEGAAVIPVSARTGAGLERLVDELSRLVDGVPTSETTRPRMWIDRSFTVSGAGTVVTGTLLGGRLMIDDRVAIWPEELQARIRSLQSHEQSRDSIGPRTRTAVNLGGIDRNDIGRGSMLGRPNHWMMSDEVLVEIRTARYSEGVTDRGAHHLHIGSGSWPVRLRLIDEGVARLDLDEPLPMAAGDRFVLRDTGRRLVVAGGRILDPAPPRRRRNAQSAATMMIDALSGNPNRRAQALLDIRGEDDVQRLSAHSGGGRAEGMQVGTTQISEKRAAELRKRAAALVSEFHDANPLRPGIPIARLASELTVSVEVVAELVATGDELRVDNADIRATGFEIAMTGEQAAMIDETMKTLRSAGWSVPRVSELDINPELFHSLVRTGALVRVSEEFYYPAERLDSFIRSLEGIQQPFTVSTFKEHLEISRKHAVPLLEWSDMNALTIRTGESRTIRR